MNNYLVVFRSRTETMKFANILGSYGFATSVVNTPRQISVSCGISVKITAKALEISRQILKRRQFYTCAGIFLICNNEYVKTQ